METPLQSQGNVLSIPVAANTAIAAGTIVCADANGRAAKGADTAGLRAAGVAEHDANNTGGDAGAIPVAVNRRVTWLANSEEDPVAQADLLKVVYIEDENTISKTGGENKVAAGVMVGINADATLVAVDFSLAPIAV